MSKPKTAAELGIPKGYRITEATSKNIVNACLMSKFKDEIYAMGLLEVNLMREITKIFYPEKKIEAYRKSIIQMTESSHFDGMTTVIEINIHIYTFGGRYRYTHKDGLLGIINTMVFQQALAEYTAKELGIENDKSSDSTLGKWVGKHASMTVPAFSIPASMSAKHWINMKPTLKKKVVTFFEDCQQLLNDIARIEQTVEGILIQYTSAIKLCNDAPQFIKYIQKASVYNEHGKKCTDVNTFDLIHELETLE